LISNGWTQIGLTATPIDGVHNQPSRITIHNNDNATDIYLGGSGVTATSGLLLLKEQSYQFTLNPLEQLYAVSTKTGHVISWMRQPL
jgi:hypothetical protein